MVNDFEIFFSNRLDVLYQYLKQELFGENSSPFMRRMVVVYGPAMKSWLTLKMAQDPDLEVSMGIEIVYLNQALARLMNQDSHIPSSLEVALAIEKELKEILNLSADEQMKWAPLLNYFHFNPKDSNPLTKKGEKRLILLSSELAKHFQNYGRFAPRMIAKWVKEETPEWQQRLWKKIFNGNWTYPVNAMQKKGNRVDFPFTVHFFSISFATSAEFDFLQRLSAEFPVRYYLLSPCAVYWSDIRSDKERTRLQAFLEKKFGSSSKQIQELEEFLMHRNPLLANFGRMGREMASQIEESFAVTHAHYVLPSQALESHKDLLSLEDFEIESSSPSLLHAIQADLLTMREPQKGIKIDFKEKYSIQLHAAFNKRREVQVLYNQILTLIREDASLTPSDFIVMAPKVQEYIPFIQSIFGAPGSLLDFQALDLPMETQNAFARGFLDLLNLGESRWEASSLLKLFDYSSFQARHQLSQNDCSTIRTWIEKGGIHWGQDAMHRHQLLMENQAPISNLGTWEFGLSRLLLGLTTVIHPEEHEDLKILPCGAVEFSQIELFEKWIYLLHSLQKDLKFAEKQTSMTMSEWMHLFTELLEKYFHSDSDENFEAFKNQIAQLEFAARFFKEAKFSYFSVKHHLHSLLQHGEVAFREDRLQSVRFCSLIPLRSIPAKAIALLGMEEDAFPRTQRPSSLNLLADNEESDYFPSASDYDRYLFLEALHSAKDYLLISYQGYDHAQGKNKRPSIIVEELFSYLEENYSVEGKKISEKCMHVHPFDSFHPSYFSSNAAHVNYSMSDFQAAETCFIKHKAPRYLFLEEFDSIKQVSNPIQTISLKDLSAAARNPIKFFLNKTLEIYLEDERDRFLPIDEDIEISLFEKRKWMQSALKKPIDLILRKAERENKLPRGLFKTIAEKRIKEESDEIQSQLKKSGIDPQHIFQIEFCSSCLSPTRVEEDKWLFPAMQIQITEDHLVSVSGKIPYASPLGLIELNKNSLPNIWKLWPEFLLYCHATSLAPESWERNILFTKSRAKAAFSDPSEEALKGFIGYYELCRKQLSPLMPEWISYIIKEDVGGLKNSMRSFATESFMGYRKKEILWLLDKYRLPSAEMIIKNWKPLAEKLTSFICTNESMKEI